MKMNRTSVSTSATHHFDFLLLDKQLVDRFVEDPRVLVRAQTLHASLKDNVI